MIIKKQIDIRPWYYFFCSRDHGIVTPFKSIVDKKKSFVKITFKKMHEASEKRFSSSWLLKSKVRDEFKTYPLPKLRPCLRSYTHARKRYPKKITE
jgi:hypothetical protein